MIVYRLKPKDGVVAWTWFTLYGITRTIAEIWRQPDFMWMGITGGQLYALPMIVDRHHRHRVLRDAAGTAHGSPPRPPARRERRRRRALPTLRQRDRRRAARSRGRDPAALTLVGVTKRQPLEASWRRSTPA